MTPDTHDTHDDGEGLDLDWLLTRGADMSWHYAFAVQPLLVDLEAGRAAEDWTLCAEVGFAVLRAIAACEYRDRGIALGSTSPELEVRLATDPSPTARALRALPDVHGADRAAADQVMAVVAERDAALRSRLPFQPPVIRTARGSAQSRRLSASLIRWRKERGFPLPKWGPSPAGEVVRWLSPDD